MTAAAVSIRLIRLSPRRLHPPDRVLIEKPVNGATRQASSVARVTDGSYLRTAAFVHMLLQFDQ
jgi:hypothetical protein